MLTSINTNTALGKYWKKRTNSRNLTVILQLFIQVVSRHNTSRKYEFSLLNYPEPKQCYDETNWKGRLWTLYASLWAAFKHMTKPKGEKMKKKSTDKTFTMKTKFGIIWRILFTSLIARKTLEKAINFWNLIEMLQLFIQSKFAG